MKAKIYTQWPVLFMMALFCLFLFLYSTSHVFANGTATAGGGVVKLTNPLGGVTTISQFVQLLLRAVVAIGIPIAIFFIVFAGFKFVVAQGNSEKLSEARRNFVHVVIGIAIFLGAWTLAMIIQSTLQQIGANV